MEDNKQPENKFRMFNVTWGVCGLIILAFAFIFFVGYMENKSSVKECDVSGCNNTCKKDEKYCQEHRHYDLKQKERLNTISRKLRNMDTSKQESKATKESTISNNNFGDIYDADSYDNPDDFADEWEDDFDSWEDAYDYWEDVME